VKNLFQLKTHQGILVGVLIAVGLLLAGKAFLGANSQQANAVAKVKSPAKLQLEQYGKIGQKWQSPLTLTMREHKIFVSRLIAFSPKTGSIAWLDPEKPMDDGITPAWKLKYGFSLEDTNLKNEDADNDGFTNMEEYQAHTDPTDPKSRPSILVKLKMAQYNYVPFRIQFKAANKLSDGTLTFQLNLLDVSQKKTRFVKNGDILEGFKVGEYREKIVQKPMGGVTVTVDESELDLINVKLNETVVLVLNTQKESDESHVKFQINIPDAKLVPNEVKRGDTFKLQYQQDGTDAEYEFQLIKGSAQGATIKNTKTGEVVEINTAK
jgi:hypothetical protein